MAAAEFNADGVLKHDDSGAGDGNRVIDLRTPGALRSTLEALPAWYLDDLAAGGVVEELVSGDRFSTPSVQIDVVPGGRVVVLATHEQVMGGANGQVYMGCRFPADPPYAAELARHGLAVGERLAERGVSIDELDTEIASAPMSAENLFKVKAVLVVPVALSNDELRRGLEALANEMMVDIALGEDADERAA